MELENYHIYNNNQNQSQAQGQKRHTVIPGEKILEEDKGYMA